MNNADFLQNSALAEAVRLKRFDDMEYLLRQGADVNSVDDSSDSAGRFFNYKASCLQMLIRYDLLNYVQLFLEKGADPNYISPSRQTPVYDAIAWGRFFSYGEDRTERKAARFKIIPLLIANGGDFTIKVNNNKRIIDLVGETTRAVIKKQLFKNAVYDQLMQPFASEEIAHGVIWALLMPSITLFSLLLNQGDGTVKALQHNAQQDEDNKSYHLPPELWIKIFSWVLSDELTHKPALLHLLPYKNRHIDTVESSFNYFLGHQPPLIMPEKSEVEAAAQTQLDDEWNKLMRPTP